MSSSLKVVRSVQPLGFPYKTLDPFLFCVYHRDNYPVGHKDHMGAPKRGNGADFDWSQDYRMYHGETIPGFPQHPHRGFETLTLIQEGTCDHTDSLGASGRYGGNGRAGDLQWMTAGKGCVHGENFPLRFTDKPNTLKLFQLWLNLPKKSKFCEPGFVMSWAEQMQFIKGTNGAECEVAAGQLGNTKAPRPAPADSWGSDPKNDVGVFYVTLPKNSTFELPAATYGKDINRMAYVVEGSTAADGGIYVGGELLRGGRGAMVLEAELPCLIENRGSEEAVHVLILQGRPINEPVVQRGPFVMNTDREIMDAFRDYQRTQFGGWPWKQDAMVFPREQGRFAEMVVDGKKIREDPAQLFGDSKSTVSTGTTSPAKEEL